MLRFIYIVDICFVDFCEALENITNQFSINMLKSNIGKFLKRFIFLSSVDSVSPSGLFNTDNFNCTN